MQSLYWLCFIAGGTFVTLSALGGIDGVEFDYDTDLDVELRELNSDNRDYSQPYRSSTYEARNSRVANRVRFLITILTSFRFWTVSSGFFGLTGLLFSGLYPTLGSRIIFAIALIVGLSLGIAIAALLIGLHVRRVDSLVRTTDLAGLMGVVELPFDANSKGKVRVDVRGTLVDFVARTDESEQCFEQGDRVLIIGTQNNRLWVVAAD